MEVPEQMESLIKTFASGKRIRDRIAPQPKRREGKTLLHIVRSLPTRTENHHPPDGRRVHWGAHRQGERSRQERKDLRWVKIRDNSIYAGYE
jgi:hypothetical protein